MRHGKSFSTFLRITLSARQISRRELAGLCGGKAKWSYIQYSVLPHSVHQDRDTAPDEVHTSTFTATTGVSRVGASVRNLAAANTPRRREGRRSDVHSPSCTAHVQPSEPSKVVVHVARQCSMIKSLAVVTNHFVGDDLCGPL